MTIVENSGIRNAVENYYTQMRDKLTSVNVVKLNIGNSFTVWISKRRNEFRDVSIRRNEYSDEVLYKGVIWNARAR